MPDCSLQVARVGGYYQLSRKELLPYWEQAHVLLEAGVEFELSPSPRHSPVRCRFVGDLSDGVRRLRHPPELSLATAEGVREPAARIEIRFEGSRSDEQFLAVAVGRFLENLYLAMNLAAPGALSLGGASFAPHPYRFLSEPPQLFPDQLDVALWKDHEEGWGLLSSVSVDDAWTWLEHLGLHGSNMAVSGVEKAVFFLLRQSEFGGRELDSLLHLTQVFEDVFGVSGSGVTTILRRRLEALFGLAETETKWVKKLYSLRSKITHGSEPWLRPDDMRTRDDPEVDRRFSDYWRSIDIGTAAVLGLLQRLIVAGAIGIEFDEQMRFMHRAT